MIDRGAHRLGEAAIAEAGRDSFLYIDYMVVTDSVELFGGDAGHYILTDKFETSAARRPATRILQSALGYLSSTVMMVLWDLIRQYCTHQCPLRECFGR